MCRNRAVQENLGGRKMKKCIDCGKRAKSGDNFELYNGCCMECYRRRVENIRKAMRNPIFLPASQYESGWVCPKCGSVMSPRQQYCLNCSPIVEKTIITWGTEGSQNFDF